MGNISTQGIASGRKRFSMHLRPTCSKAISPRRFLPGVPKGNICNQTPRGTESTRMSPEVLYLKQTSPRDGKEGEEGESRGGAQPYKTKFICCWALSRNRIGLAATEKQILGLQRQPKRSSVPRGCPQMGYSCQTHAD